MGGGAWAQVTKSHLPSVEPFLHAPSADMGTLLFDLLEDPEAADRRNVFDIPLLASRLVLAQVG